MRVKLFTEKSSLLGVLLIGLTVISLVPGVAGAGGYVNPTPIGVIVPTPADFHTYASLQAELEGLNASKPDLVRLETIGTSIQNRTIYALRITEGSGDKPNILFMGLHHSNEWMSLETVAYLARYFLANAHETSRIDTILEKANLWFIPLVNPDGLEYSQVHDNLWRKNRRDNGDGTFGVDLNRNYGFQWGVGPASNTTDIEYPGPDPFSEPETIAIRDFALANTPAFSMSYHSAGGWILFPWSYTPQPTSSDGLLRGVALQMSNYNGYRLLQEGKSNHVKAGNADDWLYHSFGTLAYTVEVGPSFSSQDNNEIGSVLLSNVMPAVVGTELALHITDLNCTPKELLCVPAISVVTIGVPLLAGSVFFGVRVIRRNRDRQNDPDYVGQSTRPTESASGALSSFA